MKGVIIPFNFEHLFPGDLAGYANGGNVMESKNESILTGVGATKFRKKDETHIGFANVGLRY